MPAYATCAPAEQGIDPATGQPYTYWAGAQAFGDAGLFSYKYGWDNVSIRPDCIGPLLSAVISNNNPETWYAHFKGRRDTWRKLEIASGASLPLNKGQLNSRGFQDNTDLENMTFSTDPNPPAA